MVIPSKLPQDAIVEAVKSELLRVSNLAVSTAIVGTVDVYIFEEPEDIKRQLDELRQNGQTGVPFEKTRLNVSESRFENIYDYSFDFYGYPRNELADAKATACTLPSERIISDGKWTIHILEKKTENEIFITATPIGFAVATGYKSPSALIARFQTSGSIVDSLACVPLVWSHKVMRDHLEIEVKDNFNGALYLKYRFALDMQNRLCSVETFTPPACKNADNLRITFKKSMVYHGCSSIPVKVINEDFVTRRDGTRGVLVRDELRIDSLESLAGQQSNLSLHHFLRGLPTGRIFFSTGDTQIKTHEFLDSGLLEKE